jgi:hypothetical protein
MEMNTNKRQSILKALNELEEFILRQRELAQQTGRKEGWERDWAFLKTVRELVSRYSKDEMRKFLEVDFRGLSHYFGAYCDDRELGKILDSLYLAFKDAIQSESQ